MWRDEPLGPQALLPSPLCGDGSVLSVLGWFWWWPVGKWLSKHFLNFVCFSNKNNVTTTERKFLYVCGRRGAGGQGQEGRISAEKEMSKEQGKWSLHIAFGRKRKLSQCRHTNSDLLSCQTPGCFTEDVLLAQDTYSRKLMFMWKAWMETILVLSRIYPDMYT